MPGVKQCPGGEQLEQFLQADLSDEEMEAVAAHVEACEACWRRVESDAAQAAGEDDLRWASKLRDQTQLDVNVPLARLNELLPDYEVAAEIGRGGMGIVYRARQLKLNRVVALKVLPALLGAVRPDAIARFRREAELAAGLEHTNIIGVYDFGEVDGTFYYAMQLIEGWSLQDVLAEIAETEAIDVVIGAEPPTAASSQPSAVSRKEEATRQRGNEETSGRDEGTKARRDEGAPQSAIRNPQSEIGTSDIRHPRSPALTRIGSSAGTDRAYFRRVAAWFADVAEALHYAHEQGVIHRDIKPANLLLSVDGRIMISDFGLARASGVQTVTGSRSLLGTCRYMSPEQVDETRGPVGRGVDVYALGATLYELLAFRPMFAARDDREVLSHVLNEEPTPPHRFVRQVPRELETICLKAVEKDRTSRYANAKAMADDLRRWLLDLPIHAKRPSLVVRAGKFVRRRKVLTAAVCTSVVLLIATGFLYAGYRGSQREAAQAVSAARSQSTELLLLQAHQDRSEGRFSEALGKVDAALAQQPESMELRYLRGKLLWEAGRKDEALGHLEDVVARKPDDWSAHYLLAKMYRELEDEDKAGYHRAQVDRLMPETAEAYFVQASEAADPHRAIELLNKAIELEPLHVDLMIERSRRYHELGQYEAMLLDAERVVATRYAMALPHAQRGLALLSLGRYAEAEEAYSRAIERDPQSAAAWHNRGLAKHKQGRFAEALADAGEAIRLDPQFARAYLGRARAHAGLGNLEEALVDCGQAIQLDPTDVESYLSRAFLCAQVGRWQEVIADNSRVVQLSPDDSRGYANRALAYLRTAEYERAIADLTRLVELEPDSAETYGERAIAYAQTEQYVRAIADYDRAVELGLDSPLAFRNRAAYCLRLGRYENAIADLTRLIEMKPGNAVAVLKRGMAYELAGGSELALANYERAEAMGGPTGQYAKLWRYILLRQSGQEQAAVEILTSQTSAETGQVWIDALFDFFAGDLSRDELLEAAANGDEHCEAYYYLARKALLEGRPDAAKDAFAQCLALDKPRRGIMEADFARALLKQMKERAASKDAE